MTRTAFIFPGQGSQYLGMLSDLATDYPLVQARVEHVSSRVGYDVWELMQTDKEHRLNETQYTQVAVLTANVIIYELLSTEFSLTPSMMAGHSLGEYAALVCAQALSLEDAAQLVSKRGQIMQHAVPLGYGAMAAIVGLADDVVSAICAEVSRNGSSVSPANFNAIGQVVVAGHSDAVERVIAKADANGARLAKIIPVSVPCHCGLLKECATEFAKSLETVAWKRPVIDVISNVDLSIYESITQMKQLLAAQLYSPVRWVETINLMHTKGIDRVVECGPGKVLSGLVKRINKGIKTLPVGDLAGINSYRLSDV